MRIREISYYPRDSNSVRDLLPRESRSKTGVELVKEVRVSKNFQISSCTIII